MINILLNGLCGKMGQEVLKEASSVFQDKCKIVCGIEKDFTIFNNINVYNDPYSITENPNVIIDFSVPKATLKILKYAKEKNLPIVIATTRFFL